MAASNPQLDRAKQGDPDAIAALMRRSLQPKGIDVTAAPVVDGVLPIVLSGDKSVNQESLVSFIRKGMVQLGAKPVRAVQIDWRLKGNELMNEWSETIILSDDNDFGFGAVGLSQLDEPTVPPVDESALPYPEDDGYPVDSGEDPSEDPSPKGKKGKKAKSEGKSGKKGSSPLLLLLVLLAGLAALVYAYQRGQLAPVVELLPPEVQSVLPPVVPEPMEPLVGEPPAQPPAAPGGPAPGSPPAPAGAVPASPPPAPPVGAVPASPPPAPPVGAVPASPPPAPPAGAVPASPPPAPPAGAVPASPPPAPPAGAAPAAPPQVPPEVLAKFSEAVKSAEGAAKLAQTAKTKAEWQAVGASWQKAIAAMQAIPPAAASQHAIAQDRIPKYQANLQAANQRAQQAP